MTVLETDEVVPHPVVVPEAQGGRDMVATHCLTSITDGTPLLSVVGERVIVHVSIIGPASLEINNEGPRRIDSAK